MTVEAWPVTDSGLADDNEDFVLIHQPTGEAERRFSGSLYVVADGQGGGERGRMASRYAAQKIMHTYYTSDEPDLGLRLREAVGAANADLFAYTKQRPELVKLGATVVAAAVRGEQCHVASVGGCRAYLIRDGAIERVTRDHTLVQQLLDEGAISAEEADDHPRREVILRTLGTEEAISIDVFDLRLNPDDALVICTDGLSSVMHDDEIANVVVNLSPRNAAEMLVQKATDRGGKDNITVITALIRDGAPPVVSELPHTWDGGIPSFDEQPTMAVSRSEAREAVDKTIQTRRVEAPANGVKTASAPTYQPEVKPAPTYQGETVVPDAPATAPPAPEQAPTSMPPTQPSAATMPKPMTVPPGYAIDPETGLPPVPVQAPPQQIGQPAGYQPRVYQPPSQPSLRTPRRGGGMTIGTFAAIGAGTVVIVLLMVLLLTNPFDWQVPFLGGGDEIPVGEAAPVDVTPTEITVPTPIPATEPPDAEEPTAEPVPTTAPAPPNMVLVPGGSFTRGVTEEEATKATLACIDEAEDNTICYPEYFADATPVEDVTLREFYIDITEVTNEAYADCVLSETCTPPSDTEFFVDVAFAHHPVVYVTYEQAVTYCGWLGKRLPTEAEWEKAARYDPATGASYWYPWGNEFEEGRANTLSAGLGGLSAVEAFARDLSPTGVLGMAGNASEWVQDWYFGSYDGLGTLDPVRIGDQPFDEPFRVVRGGSFQSLSPFARSGHRYDVPEDTGASWVGFRCAQDVNGAETPAAPVEEEAPAEATPTGETTPIP